MELIKISVCVLSYMIFCNAIRRSSTNLRLGDTNANSGCICIPEVQNGQPLSNMIDTGNLGLERLVAYYYINTQTQKITTYIPNVDKQQIFPDLSFEDGDELQPLQTDDIYNFILMNQNKIDRPIFAQDPTNHITVDANLHPADLMSNTHNIISVNGPDTINVLNDRDFSLNAPIEGNMVYNEPMNQVLSSEDTTEMLTKPNPNIAMVGNINLKSLDSGSIMKQLLPSDDSDVTYQDLNQMPEHFSSLADGWQTSSFNNVYNWKDYILDKDHQVLDFQNGQRPSYLKFDQWFQQQMDTSLNKQIQNSVKFPDGDDLKSLVYKNLIQNGLITVENGSFKTNQGDVLNLSNLKLQPVLIGLSLGYKYPTAAVQDSVVSPHYDAMALYMNHPQRILGIIPMDSFDSSSNSMGYNTMKVNKVYPSLMTSTVVKTHCINGKCTTTTTDKDFSSRTGRPQKAVTINNKVDMNGRSANEDRNGVRVYHAAGTPLAVQSVKQLERPYFTKKSKRIPMINDLLAELYSVLLGENIKKSGKKSPQYEVRTIEDEGPDFRIVGGSAATGSGTPVSSRGRSGYE